MEIWNKIGVLDDLNARVGDETIEGILGRNGLVSRKEDELLDIYNEQELVLANDFSKKKNHQEVHARSEWWLRGGKWSVTLCSTGEEYE